MARALRLAERGRYSTHPNPRVGCVLVKQGRMVGEGWHCRAGGPHAEVAALQQAGPHARGATAYVSLEPCSHHGRTPPCAGALIEAGVTRVVAAMEDPNPHVAGQGLRCLAAAGVAVHSGVLAAEAEALNPGFCRRMREGRPWVRAKVAMSLDGRTALSNGVSQWITGEAARRDGQRLRAMSSAVLTGISTVLADDPALTVRLSPAELDSHCQGEVRQPLRVVLDSGLRLPPDARLLRQPGGTLVLTASDERVAWRRLASPRVTVHRLPRAARSLDLHAVLTHLAAEDMNEVLLEAGPTLTGALLREGLVDEWIIYLAPKILGDGARGVFKLPVFDDLAQCPRLDITDIRAVGSDWRITAKAEPVRST
ncbi:MAG TPA: bifunctional diaminohydroxyphosphoribosylaminopyrimidine deaminase/5-amino-6-(5-phosphoribosylamino)uracil reductase RibD [Gammaproteobacteria bacterium]|nr:bifunctional diaminohydroxyphosphoribosylaminopyrimidine deaminase/5-amino-6-(5-phosphoribosylamino)uracil reductase RibD [Gammaproteobacteria bacterium]